MFYIRALMLGEKIEGPKKDAGEAGEA